MTRLESAGRDMAIALLASGRSLDDARAALAAAVWSDASWLPPPAHRGDRILRARVALFLRLVRRVEAWERAIIQAERDHAQHESVRGTGGPSDLDCSHASPDAWAFPPMVSTVTDWPEMSPPAWLARWNEWRQRPTFRHLPWKPLWTSAPQHDPSTTPAQRRASRRGMVSP